jgi:hypothetical protein
MKGLSQADQMTREKQDQYGLVLGSAGYADSAWSGQPGPQDGQAGAKIQNIRRLTPNILDMLPCAATPRFLP